MNTDYLNKNLNRIVRIQLATLMENIAKSVFPGKYFIVDPSAFPYVKKIKKLLGKNQVLVMPDELAPSDDAKDIQNLNDILKYWNGYYLSPSRITELVAFVKAGKEVKRFSDLKGDLNVSKDEEVYRDLITGRKGPRKLALKEMICSLTSKIVKFAKMFHAAIISLSAKLLDLLRGTAISVFVISKRVFDQIKLIPPLLRRLKKSEDFRRKKKYVSYILALSLPVLLQLLSLSVILAYVTGGAASTVLLAFDP